jgi:hypothetical protein
MTAKKEPTLQTTQRGIELIKSCAKFYANGVGVAKPTVELSHGVSLARPATRQASTPRAAKSSISAVAVACSFVLPGLALAAIVWAATTGAGGPDLAAGDAGAKATSPAIAAPRNQQSVATAQTSPNSVSDIVIHKVKTVPIGGGASDGRDRGRDGENMKASTEIAPTD